jgi:predicted ribosomally synthesized peptide with SipW-like signal peptide
MKNVFLSVVLIGALIVAGLGGTLATWSDSETSEFNYIETGSVDLQVNFADDWPWGTGVGPKVELSCMIPQKWYGPFPVDLWNAGQCEQPSSAYIHVKNVECSNIPPKEGSGYPGPITGDLKPEPELVAEFEGWVNSVYVNGIGPEGDDCSMGTHVNMIITLTPLPPNDPDSEILLIDKLGKWECKERYLFDLWPCEPRTIYFWFLLQQFSEDDLGLPDLIVHPDDMTPVPTGDEYDAALRHWLKFNDWPSWSMMKDRADFEMEFDLWLWDP